MTELKQGPWLCKKSTITPSATSPARGAGARRVDQTPHLQQNQRMLLSIFQSLQLLAEGPQNSQFPTPHRTPCRRHGNRAPRSAPAQGWVRGALSGKPGLPRLASALGVATATSPPPRLAPAEALAASPRTGAGSSGRCRKAQRILGEPGSRRWDCGVPRDRLCNRQGPQPGQGRRPRGTSASRTLPAAQPGRSLVAAHVAPPSLTTTPPSWERASWRGLGDPHSRSCPHQLRKLKSSASSPAALACMRGRRRGAEVSAPFRDQAGQTSLEASQVLRRTAPPLACSSLAGG